MGRVEGDEAALACRGCSHPIGNMDPLETCRQQRGQLFAPVVAPMVARGIRVSVTIRGSENCDTTGPESPFEVRYKGGIVVDVLDHLNRNDRIEGFRGVGT